MLREADSIEKFHLSFKKIILHVKKSTPTCYVYGELGVFPLLNDRQVRVLKYWVKLIRNNDRSLKVPRIIHKELVAISNNNENAVKWASLVRDLLTQSGMGIYWYNQHVGNENAFISCFK